MNVQEFRANLKKHFDDAVRGIPVVVERGGMEFVLIAHPKGVGVAAGKVIKTPTEAKEAVEVITKYERGKKPVRLCPIHKTPMDSRGKCLQKGCKYA